MNREQAERHIRARLDKLCRSDPKIHNAYLLVHSDRHALHLRLAAGESLTADGQPIPAHPDQPLFMASVGKLFTATLVGLLVEQGKLTFDSRLADFVDADLLHGLHVYRGVEYSQQIRLCHLLNHTSGLHDYFEDRPPRGKPMLARLLDEPQRTWTPREVVSWSKENLRAHFPPGKAFHYSDTGYHLLGLVIEAVTGMPFHTALSRYIFQPLGMRQAFLLGHSQPEQPSPQPLAGVFNGHINVVHYPSLSVDYAGGGVTAPLEDFLLFLRGLANGRVLQPATLARMEDTARFSIGIDYGYGIMYIRSVPLIMPPKFNCWGNAGSTGAFMFYSPALDACLIGSLNQFRYPAKGIRFMMQVMDTLWNNLKA